MDAVISSLRPALIFVLCLIALPLRARADESADNDVDTEVARRHFQAGSAAYDHGDYASALTELEHARMVRPLPALDYNIGRCHDRLEHYAEAIAAYQRFVDETANEPDRAEARARIETLRERQRQLAVRLLPSVAPAPASPRPRDLAPAHGYVGPIAVGSVGLAALVAGFALYGTVGGDYSALAHSCAPDCPPSRWSGLQTRERAGVGLAIGGGVVVAASVIYALVVARRHHRARLTAPAAL
jgi:tetratricopeptide (TPR) repeat protein